MLWLVLLGGHVGAQPPAWGLEQLMHVLGQRDHGRASFTETKYLRLLSRPLTLKGTLSYQAPDRLEKRTLEPNEEILLVDGDRVTVEIPVRRIKRSFALQEHPVLWGFVESIRATLLGDGATLERFYHADLRGGPEGWRLSLKPIDARMAAVIGEIRIAGTGGSVSSVEILETRGDRSVIKIRE